MKRRFLGIPVPNYLIDITSLTCLIAAGGGMAWAIIVLWVVR